MFPFSTAMLINSTAIFCMTFSLWTQYSCFCSFRTILHWLHVFNWKVNNEIWTYNIIEITHIKKKFMFQWTIFWIILWRNQRKYKKKLVPNSNLYLLKEFFRLLKPIPSKKVSLDNNLFLIWGSVTIFNRYNESNSTEIATETANHWLRLSTIAICNQNGVYWNRCINGTMYAATALPNNVSNLKIQLHMVTSKIDKLQLWLWDFCWVIICLIENEVGY